MLHSIVRVTFLFLTITNIALSGNIDKKPHIIYDSDTWPVYSKMHNGDRVCFISAIPSRSSGNFKTRDSASVTFSTKDGKHFTVIATSGYTYINFDSSILKIGRKMRKTNNNKQNETLRSFNLQIIGNNGVANGDISLSILKTVKTSNIMMLYGKSQLQTYSEDEFSLVGFNNSLEFLLKECTKY